MITAHQTAILLAVILNRSEQSRARVSAKTIKLLAIRRNLRSAFVLELITEIAEFGWILFEISSGGFGAVQAKTLEAAKPVTAKRFLTDEERRDLRQGTITPETFERYLKSSDEEAVDEE